MGYVFFDTETTGLDPSFDQIVQFAAVKTNYELEELDHFEFRCRIDPQIVPHPAAIRANGLSIEQLTDRNLPSHYEMVSAVRRKLLDWSPSIFVGFNSMSFDEEMLRHALYRCLYPAYLTGNHNNGRADAFGLIQAACALTPGCLIIPRKPDGRPTFKLDQFAPANDVPHDRAHDAMCDVRATIELCRLVKQRSDEAWQRFVRFSNRAAVAELVDEADGFILTEFFGGEPYHRAVVCIGAPPSNANGRFCLDLSTDPETWRAMTDEEIRSEIARKGTPVRRLRVNGAPTLTNFYDAPDDLADGLDLELAEERAIKLKEDPALCQRIASLYAASWAERPPSPYPEKCLYSGSFPPYVDTQRSFEFHDAHWRLRAKIANEYEDWRLQKLARRLIYNEHRSLLDSEVRLEADLELNDRLLTDRGGPLTLPRALEETDAMLTSGSCDNAEQLIGYQGYLRGRIDRAREFSRAHDAG